MAIVCFPGKLFLASKSARSGIERYYILFLIFLSISYQFFLFLSRPCIIFLDSLGKVEEIKNYARLIRNWLQNEVFEKRKSDFFISERELPIINPSTPPQTNDYDCGIFVLHYIEEFLKVLFFKLISISFRLSIFSNLKLRIQVKFLADKDWLGSVSVIGSNQAIWTPNV